MCQFGTETMSCDGKIHAEDRFYNGSETDSTIASTSVVFRPVFADITTASCGFIILFQCICNSAKCPARFRSAKGRLQVKAEKRSLGIPVRFRDATVPGSGQ